MSGLVSTDAIHHLLSLILSKQEPHPTLQAVGTVVVFLLLLMESRKPMKGFRKECFSHHYQVITPTTKKEIKILQ